MKSLLSLVFFITTTLNAQAAFTCKGALSMQANSDSLELALFHTFPEYSFADSSPSRPWIRVTQERGAGQAAWHFSTTKHISGVRSVLQSMKSIWDNRSGSIYSQSPQMDVKITAGLDFIQIKLSTRRASNSSYVAPYLYSSLKGIKVFRENNILFSPELAVAASEIIEAEIKESEEGVTLTLHNPNRNHINLMALLTRGIVMGEEFLDMNISWL